MKFLELSSLHPVAMVTIFPQVANQPLISSTSTAWVDLGMVITLLRVSVAAWSATPVRALYHLCLSLNLTRVNQSPSPFFMENGDDSRLIWASKNCCNAGLLGQVLIDTTISAGALDDADGAKNLALAVGQCWVLHIGEENGSLPVIISLPRTFCLSICY